MTDEPKPKRTTKRKVTIDGSGKSVISNLRVPFARGTLVDVVTTSESVTVMMDDEPCAHGSLGWSRCLSVWCCIDCGKRDVVLP
jgi:hypothetical protein